MKSSIGKSVLAAAFGSLLAGGAVAADLPGRGAPASPGPVFSPVQAYNWSGVYAGLNAGYGWGSFQRGTKGLIGSTSGAALGATLGYNYQMGSFVIGAEGDLNKSWERGGRNFVGPAATKGSLDWFGTLRARAGFAADRALVYATGGYAFGKLNASVNDTGIPAAFSNSSIRHGYALGAGIEYAFTNNISAKAEYLYMNLGGGSVFGAPYVQTSGYSTSIIRAGVNYHF
ncbi:MAG: porin family protein [Alphaproteobacteria bacterium]|nr:porin family protein [Alphaproteobacteria bacterium]